MVFLILRSLMSWLRSRRGLALENLALRHQLHVLQRGAKKPRLKSRDRGLWVFLYFREAALVRQSCQDWPSDQGFVCLGPDRIARRDSVSRTVGSIFLSARDHGDADRLLEPETPREMPFVGGIPAWTGYELALGTWMQFHQLGFLAPPPAPEDYSGLDVSSGFDRV